MEIVGRRLAALRIADPIAWERIVRAAIKNSPTFEKASEALAVHRDTLREWCRQLGIPKGKPGGKRR